MRVAPVVSMPVRRPHRKRDCKGEEAQAHGKKRCRVKDHAM
jgi:hypothetical protein